MTQSTKTRIDNVIAESLSNNGRSTYLDCSRDDYHTICGILRSMCACEVRYDGILPEFYGPVPNNGRPQWKVRIDFSTHLKAQGYKSQIG